MQLLTMRHGETDWNSRHKMQGRTDIGLNELGRMQAMEAGRNLREGSVDLVFCSPLVRARQTAELVIGNRDVKIKVDDRLTERCFGEWEGKSFTSEERLEFWDCELNSGRGGVEPVLEMLARVDDFLDEMQSRYNKNKVLVVTHGGVLKLISGRLNDELGTLGCRKFSVGNCEVVTYELNSFKLRKDKDRK